LQLDGRLVAALWAHRFEVAIETNGTRALAFRPDWVTVSPKAGTELVVTQGDELKLVFRGSPTPDRRSPIASPTRGGA
jgi:7-carboxy-7-deazaguanine synthase